MRFFNLMFVLVLFSAPARAADPIVVLPYRVDYEGWLTVEATINGDGPYDFIVDTRSAKTLVFANLAAASTFPASGEEPKPILGVTGDQALPTFSIGDISIGGAVLEDHKGAIMSDWPEPLKSPQGLLGLDFFSKYAAVFDDAAKTMTLYPSGGVPEDAVGDWTSVKLKANSFGAADGALITVAGKANGADVTFIVDLGSAVTIINYKAAEAFYRGVVRGGNQGLTTGSRTSDMFGDRSSPKSVQMSRIQIGRALWQNRVILIYDSPILAALNVERLAYGLIGRDLLAASSFAMDVGADALWIDD